MAGFLFAAAAPAATLEEVVVTATRSAIPLERYAGSATRITAETVGLAGATHASELINRAAGAMIQRGSGEESLTALRSPVLTGAGACGAVLVLEDSHPDPAGRDLQRQRALRGELRAGGGHRGAARPGQRAVRLERGARHHQRHPAPAGRDPGLRRRGRVRQRRLAPAAARGVARGGPSRNRRRDDRHRRRRLARRLGIRGTEAERGVDAGTRGRIAQALALGLEPRPGDGGLHPGRGRLSRPRARALESRSRRPTATRLPCASPRSTIGATGNELRFVLRSSRMDFLQHFLLGQPVEDNGQDSGGLMFTTRRARARGRRADRGRRRGARDQHPAPVPGRADDRRSPAANAIRPAGKHYDYAVDLGVLAGYADWRRPLGERSARSRPGCASSTRATTTTTA